MNVSVDSSLKQLDHLSGVDCKSALVVVELTQARVQDLTVNLSVFRAKDSSEVNLVELSLDSNLPINSNNDSDVALGMSFLRLDLGNWSLLAW